MTERKVQMMSYEATKGPHIHCSKRRVFHNRLTGPDTTIYAWRPACKHIMK